MAVPREPELRFGSYVVEGPLGSGGMGVVYRARHERLGRLAAVKVLPKLLAGEAARKRFEREARVMGQLAHPNTVQIFDFGCASDGAFYYVMEFLDGIDLSQLVKLHGPQPVERVLHVVRQVAAALAEVHAAGLVHRDVKPANIMLCKHGGLLDFAKVLDFGLAKDLRARALASVDDPDDRLITGTPGYLAPEAITSPWLVDSRSDTYALGAVAYYMLTGEPLFEGSLAAVCDQHVHSVPPPPSIRRGEDVPRDLEDIVTACLSKEPDRRPRDGRALRTALDACVGIDPWTEEDARAWWDAHSPGHDPCELRSSVHSLAPQGSATLATTRTMRVKP